MTHRGHEAAQKRFGMREGTCRGRVVDVTFFWGAELRVRANRVTAGATGWFSEIRRPPRRETPTLNFAENASAVGP